MVGFWGRMSLHPCILAKGSLIWANANSQRILEANAYVIFHSFLSVTTYLLLYLERGKRAIGIFSRELWWYQHLQSQQEVLYIEKKFCFFSIFCSFVKLLMVMLMVWMISLGLTQQENLNELLPLLPASRHLHTKRRRALFIKKGGHITWIIYSYKNDDYEQKDQSW